jgi:DNA-directed RNA polymerase subunit RPC12/RpoP
MTADRLPVYEHCIDETMNCRCTACGGWWAMESTFSCAPLNVDYWCPHCGKRLTPAHDRRLLVPDDFKPTPELRAPKELEL